MIKRSFFTLSQPRLNYDLVEPDPKEPELIPIPPSLILLLNEPIDSTKETLIKKGAAVEKGEKLCLYNDSTEYTISPIKGTITGIDTYSDNSGNTSTSLIIKNDHNLAAGQTDSATYVLKDNIASADQYLRTLPGAPPLKILASNDVKINTIVITCGDTDLLSTTHQYITLKFGNEIKEGAKILKKITQVPKLCIAIPEGLKINEEFDSHQVFKTALEYPSNLPAMILKRPFKNSTSCR